MQSDDFEEGDLLPPALAVDDNEDDFDLKIPATSGNEYLRRVRQEAKGCPQVVVASLDVKAFNSKQTVKYKEPSGCLPAPRGYSVTQTWRKAQIADFAELRQKILRLKSMLARGEHKLKRPILPNSNDAEGWCRLCFGHLKIKVDNGQNEGGQSSEEPMIEGNGVADISLADYDIKDGPSTSESSTQGTQPLLSILLFMDQPTVMKVLEYHVNWLEATGFSSHQGRWFYALLACLQKPLVPEVCSLIRDLARFSSHLRICIENESDPRLNELNLMITLVTHYFDQTDLKE